MTVNDHPFSYTVQTHNFDHEESWTPIYRLAPVQTYEKLYYNDSMFMFKINRVPLREGHNLRTSRRRGVPSSRLAWEA